MTDMMAVIWHKHKNTFFQALSTIRSSEEYCDATLACDGHFYKVHKFIISTCSEFFDKMFKEVNSQGVWFSHPVIVLQDIKHEQLETLLDYMYQGEVNVLKDELSGVMKIAQVLKIKGLGVSGDIQEKEIYYEDEIEDTNELRSSKEKLLHDHQNHNSSHSVSEKILKVKLDRLKISKEAILERLNDNDNIQDASELKVKTENSVIKRANIKKMENDSITQFKPINKKKKKKRGRRPAPVSDEILNSDLRSPEEVWTQKFKGMMKGVACPFCKKIYSNKTNFIYHFESHKPSTLTCSKCPFTTTRKSFLTKHLNIKHSKSLFFCNHCSKTFQFKSNLMEHIHTCQLKTDLKISVDDMSLEKPDFQGFQNSPNKDGNIKETLQLDIAGPSGEELNKIFLPENSDNVNINDKICLLENQDSVDIKDKIFLPENQDSFFLPENPDICLYDPFTDNSEEATN